MTAFLDVNLERLAVELLRALTEGKCPKQWQAIKDAALRKLDRVRYAARLEDLKVPPSIRLEALQGARKGEYSIRIAGNASRYRIVFKWSEDGAYDIKIEDYHRR